jgi:hypothetical protein
MCYNLKLSYLSQGVFEVVSCNHILVRTAICEGLIDRGGSWLYGLVGLEGLSSIVK